MKIPHDILHFSIRFIFVREYILTCLIPVGLTFLKIVKFLLSLKTNVGISMLSSEVWDTDQLLSDKQSWQHECMIPIFLLLLLLLIF